VRSTTVNAAQIARKLEGARNELEHADATRDESQIGHILIAISMLTDVIEQIIAQQASMGRAINDLASDHN
jgi:hypothetical protein